LFLSWLWRLKLQDKGNSVFRMCVTPTFSFADGCLGYILTWHRIKEHGTNSHISSYSFGLFFWARDLLFNPVWASKSWSFYFTLPSVAPVFLARHNPIHEGSMFLPNYLSKALSLNMATLGTGLRHVKFGGHIGSISHSIIAHDWEHNGLQKIMNI
jgi:hypothetical protein